MGASVLIFGEARILGPRCPIITLRITRRVNANTDTRVTRKDLRAFVLFTTRRRNLAVYGARENPRSWSPPPPIPGAGGCKDKEAKKSSRRERGGDKRETVGETFPSSSNSERRKRGKKDCGRGERGFGLRGGREKERKA